jgi:hypothetical protein
VHRIKSLTAGPFGLVVESLKKRLSPATAEVAALEARRVMALGYTNESEMASDMLVGFVMPSPANPSFISFILAVFRRLRQSAYSRFF